MRRYFFHLVIGTVLIQDREGVELPDDDAARERAHTDILKVSTAGTIKRQDPLACAVVVEDSEGPRFRVPFAEVPAVVRNTMREAP